MLSDLQKFNFLRFVRIMDAVLMDDEDRWQEKEPQESMSSTGFDDADYFKFSGGR